MGIFHELRLFLSDPGKHASAAKKVIGTRMKNVAAPSKVLIGVALLCWISKKIPNFHTDLFQ